MVYATEHRNLDLLHYCNFMLRVSWVATSRWSSCVRAIRCSLFVNRLTKAILVKEQLSFILCFFSLRIVSLFSADIHWIQGWCFVLIHEKQPLWNGTRRKALQAALVDPDVTGVMDGCEPAIATTCLFQSPIVWHSVITVYVASQQAASCVYYPLAHKRKRIHREKKRGHVFPLSQHVSFHWVKLPVSHFPLSHFL